MYRPLAQNKMRRYTAIQLSVHSKVGILVAKFPQSERGVRCQFLNYFESS